MCCTTLGEWVSCRSQWATRREALHRIKRKNYMKFTISPSFIASVLVSGLMAGCGGGESEGSSNTSSSGGGSSSSAASCNYTDMIKSKERAEANACGIQVSGGYGAADARLQQIIQACQSGQKAAADTDYKGPYTKLVENARATSSALSCGSGNTGTNLPNPSNPSSQTFYNFCGKTTGSVKTGSCYGPVFQNEGGCGDGSFIYVNQHATSSACIAARTNWLK